MLYIVLLTVLGLALVVLIVLAVVQRRDAAEVSPAPDRPAAEQARSAAPTPPAYAPTMMPQPPRQLGVMGVAIGVWLGLWLFTLSVAIPAAAVFVYFADRL